MSRPSQTRLVADAVDNEPHRKWDVRPVTVEPELPRLATVVGRISEAARSGNVTAQLALLRALAPEE